ncbi:MAG: pilus assembly protein PilM [Clostridiales bacterium]|jgi:type IV pilus assembly protein PilM|nr:pilus assembly protein PilM [Clostridiales bacterium]
MNLKTIMPQLKPKASDKKSAAALPKVALALDIGTRYTKLLVGKYSIDNPSITQILIAETPRHAYTDGLVTDDGKLSILLNQLVSQMKLQTKDLIFTIESTKFIKREFVLPKVQNDGDIQGLATYEMVQYLPIDIAEYTIAPQVIGAVAENDEEKIRVSVCAIPKNIIQAYQRLLTICDLKPFSMEIHSNSVEKIILHDIKHNTKSAYANKSVVFIDMGHTYFNVSFYDNGHYQFNQVLEVGGAGLNDVISKYLPLDASTAEAVKIEVLNQISVEDLDTKYGNLLPSYEAHSNYESLLIELLKVINQWVSYVDKVLSYMSRSRDKNIDKIYIYGGSSQINGIAAYLEKKLAIKTAPAKALGSCNYANDTIKRSIMSVYGNALGAFLRL